MSESNEMAGQVGKTTRELGRWHEEDQTVNDIMAFDPKAPVASVRRLTKRQEEEEARKSADEQVNALVEAARTFTIAAMREEYGAADAEVKEHGAHGPVRTVKIGPAVPALKPQQQVAIEALMQGRSMIQAAREARVDRITVYRWMRRDPAFMAALADWRGHAKRTVRNRLLGLADHAADCVEHALTRHDVKTALAILRAAGVMSYGSARRISALKCERDHESGGNQLGMEARQMVVATEAPAPGQLPAAPVTAIPVEAPKVLDAAPARETIPRVVLIPRIIK